MRAEDPGTRTAGLRIGGSRHTLRYSISSVPPTDRLDPFVAATLLIAMRVGEPIVLDGPTSEQLLENVPKIQQLLWRWDDTLHRVPVRALETAPPVHRSSRSAACFSGGVDSFHTALVHGTELDALVFVHGFDIRPQRRELLRLVSRSLARAADELGKPFVEVRTNLKLTSRRFFPWSWFHGSAIASIALLLAPAFGRFFVPGSLSYDYTYPYGSHPLLDGLWSTDATEVVYDGYAANRFEKTSIVARSGVALRWLRVCNERDDRGYNCGRCEKCLRTMVALQSLGALSQCSTLPGAVDPGLVNRLGSVRNADLWEQNLAAAEATAQPPDLLDALRTVLRDRRPAPTRMGRWRPGARAVVASL